MKFFIVTAVLLHSCFAFAAVTVTMKKTEKNASYEVFKVTVSTEQSSLTRKIYIVNGAEKDPSKFLWIFPGYKSAGDSYQQAPYYFINRWTLAPLCRKNKITAVIPDMGASMYSISEINNSEKISDMRFLKELYNELIFKKYKAAPVVLAGVSTGAEGAVKFGSLIQNIEAIAGLSGTYDFFAIPADSGEYRIHERAFGKEKQIWFNENPINILKHSVRTRLYLFSEHNSMYRAQAQTILDNKMSNLEVIDMLSLGKGFSHSWSFWGSSKVVKELHSIFAGKK